jgi:hypothetical protein
MYEVHFHHVSEIRMGSPYHSAQVQVNGGYFPQLLFSRMRSFQDKFVVNKDGGILFLVCWEHVQSDPYFRVLKILSNEKKVYISSLISGCCKDIELFSERLEVKLTIFRHPNTLTEVVDDFSTIMFDGEMEFKPDDVEEILGKWTTINGLDAFQKWLPLLRSLLNKELLREARGSVNVNLLENQLAELLKSNLDESIYFKAISGQQYQLTVKNNCGFVAHWRSI